MRLVALVSLLRTRRKIIVMLFSLTMLSLAFVQLKAYHDVPRSHHQPGAVYEVSSDKHANKDQDLFRVIKDKVMANEAIRYMQQVYNIKDNRPVELHSSVYDIIFAKHDINSVLALDFEQRCNLYFTTLRLHSASNWQIQPTNEHLRQIDQNLYKYDDFRRSKTDQLKKQISAEKGIPESEVYEDVYFHSRMQENYNKHWSQIQKIEQTVVDYNSHLRIFSKCFITSDNGAEAAVIDSFIASQHTQLVRMGEDDKMNAGGSTEFAYTSEEHGFDASFSSKRCQDLEKRIYPWLSFKYPVYERWDKTVVNHPPNMLDYKLALCVYDYSHKEAHHSRTSKSPNPDSPQALCFLNRFKDALNGKGIVLSIHDGHLHETLALIRLLRALNNKYPIQIIYKDAVSEHTKSRIVEAARLAFVDVPKSFYSVRGQFPLDYFDMNHGGLPKQEVWFVDVSRALDLRTKDDFQGFSNKFLAPMFTSFEEFMLVDADTVLTKNPDFFFNLAKYKELGAYFYKDRTPPIYRVEEDSVFFRKITPSPLDHILFDIPVVLEEFFHLEFFSGLQYFMESGNVLINKNLHFNTVMMMIQMNFIKAVAGRVYGDKEIFFLSFLASGDEKFHFNKFFAAAIGDVSPMEDRTPEPGSRSPFLSREICASHPAHIDEESQTLAWFNSGFQQCGQSGRVNYDEEFGVGKRFKKLNSKDELRAFFENRLEIKYAIVPPFKLGNTIAPNTIGEPTQPWVWDTDYCNRYLWCAYDRIGGPNGDADSTQHGTFIEFDQEAVEMFNYLGDIWLEKK